MNIDKSPLADRIRPVCFAEVLGQDHLLGPGCSIRKQIEKNRLFSMVFFGPPGSGKTTIAQLFAKQFAAHFISFSAAMSSITEIKKFMKKAEEQKHSGRSESASAGQ